MASVGYVCQLLSMSWGVRADSGSGVGPGVRAGPNCHHSAGRGAAAVLPCRWALPGGSAGRHPPDDVIAHGAHISLRQQSRYQYEQAEAEHRESWQKQAPTNLAEAEGLQTRLLGLGRHFLRRH